MAVNTFPYTKLNPTGVGPQPQPQPHPHDDLKQCMTDIVEGRPTAPHLAQLRAGIEGYVMRNLEQGREIRPGVRSTAFSHVLQRTDDSAIFPVSFEIKDTAEIIRQIVAGSLAHMENPHAAPPCSTFTIDDFLNGRQPSLQLPMDIPIHGADSNQNTVFALHPQHPAMADLLKKLSTTHEDEPVKIAGGDWVLGRANWINILAQGNDELFSYLNEKLPPEAYLEVCKMAETLKSGDINKIREHGGDKGPEFTGIRLPFEDELKKISDEFVPEKFRRPPGLNAEALNGTDFFSHATHMGGIDAVLMSDEIKSENGSARSITCSGPLLEEHAPKIPASDTAGHAKLIETAATGKPILMTNGLEMAVRFPRKASAPSPESTAGARPAPADAPKE